MENGVRSMQPSRHPHHDAATSRQASPTSPASSTPNDKPKSATKARKPDADPGDTQKRRCVSTACIACRKRKSKCDGTLPACAACASVYGTECVYDPNSDHRRKGVYKKDIDNLKTRNTTLQTLIQAILNFPEDEVMDLVGRIRSCESLDKVAEYLVARENGEEWKEDDLAPDAAFFADADPTSFEGQLSSKMGELRLDDGSVRFIGGTSNLLYANPDDLDLEEDVGLLHMKTDDTQHTNPITSWTNVTTDPELIMHLLNMYFTWHYTFFTTLSKSLFWRDFMQGKPQNGPRRKTEYCSSLLVNIMLALGCHFTAHAGAREDPSDSATAGDHFFREARRILYEEDEAEKPNLVTVQALALMSVREAGCSREARGWTYSGMSFRMACDLGLNFASGGLASKDSRLDDDEEDARRITFWGCFLFDKCWSNYMGRLPMYQLSANVTVPKFEVFPSEDAETWSPYTDSGFSQAHSQPSRIRAVALQISALCDISSDLVKYFYHVEKDRQPSKQLELKRLSEVHSRLESWRRDLPTEMEPREGGLSSVLTMHMLFQLLYIHLFRPFLKYSPQDSPLPTNTSPRRICTTAAMTISKLLRLYKRSHGLRQICNIAVYIAHSACTIHLLNLPEKNAKRDITHGFKHLEEIAEGWLCARRTLKVLSLQVRKWRIELPDEAAVTLARTDAKFGVLSSVEAMTPDSSAHYSPKVVHSMAGVSNPPPAVIAPAGKLPAQLNHTIIPAAQDMSQISPSSARVPETALDMNVNGASRFRLPSLSAYSQLANVNRSLSPPTMLGPPAVPSADMMSRSGVIPPTSTAGTQQSIMQTQVPPYQMQQRPMGSLKRSNSLMANDDAFGGVEALLKEGQDWLVRDGSSMASGFGNWQGLSAMSQNGSLDSGSWYGEWPQMGDHNSATPPQGQGHYEYNETNGTGTKGMAMSNYDENAWYQ